jgi:hypothetical protein
VTDNDEAKRCPTCAEEIKSAALVCRFCGHDFRSVRSDSLPTTTAAGWFARLAAHDVASKRPRWLTKWGRVSLGRALAETAGLLSVDYLTHVYFNYPFLLRLMVTSLIFGWGLVRVASAGPRDISAFAGAALLRGFLSVALTSRLSLIILGYPSDFPIPPSSVLDVFRWVAALGIATWILLLVDPSLRKNTFAGFRDSSAVALGALLVLLGLLGATFLVRGFTSDFVFAKYLTWDEAVARGAICGNDYCYRLTP